MKYIKSFVFLLLTQVIGLCLVLWIRNFNPGREFPLPDLFLYVSLILGLMTFIVIKTLENYPLIKSSGLGPTPTRGIFAILVTFVFLTLPLQTIGNVDRSRSTYVLGWIGCKDTSVTILELKKRVNEKLGKEAVVAMEQRLEEHRKRGIIKTSDGLIELTARGRFILNISVFLSRQFKLDGWKKSQIWESSKCI